MNTNDMGPKTQDCPTCNGGGKTMMLGVTRVCEQCKGEGRVPQIPITGAYGFIKGYEAGVVEKPNGIP